MQLHLILKASGLVLPVNYRPLIHGMIYKALAIAPAYSEYLHNREGDQKQRSFKGFTFSRLNGQYSAQGRQLMFDGAVRLEIRSCEPLFIELLRSSFSASEAVSLGADSLIVQDCRIEDYHLLREEARVHMLAPAVAYRTLENRHTQFFQPDDDQFYRSLENNALRKWQYFHAQTPCRFEVSPLFDRLPRKQFSTFKGTYITGWFGDYKLSGTPELLDLLYQTGLGAKNSEGFGMFSVDA